MIETSFSNTKQMSRSYSFGKVNCEMTESSEETIRRVLSSYDIGAKLRQLRLRKKIGLVDLGKHTGLSASMLSQLENGKLVPTLPTLARIAMVFDVSLDHFFSSKKKEAMFSIVRADERIRFPDKPESTEPEYYFENLVFSAENKSLQAYLGVFPRRAPDEVTEHSHDGAEFLHVVEGSLALRIDGEEHELAAGDSIYFDGSEPHAYRGTAEGGARAVVITTPPRI